MDTPLDLVLHGQLVDLRPTVEGDYPALQEILSDPKTMAHLQFMAHLDAGGWTVEQVRARYEEFGEGQRHGTHLNFSVVYKPTGQIAGSCGLKQINAAHKNAEFGLIIHHPFWGTGVAVECHLLCLEHAFSVLGLHRIYFCTHTTNARMRAFFEQIGIPFEHIERESMCEEGRFIDTAVYALLAHDWPPVKNALQARVTRQGSICP